MEQVVRFLFVLVLMLGTAQAGAEVLANAHPVQSDLVVPQKGITKSMVSHQFGEPAQVMQAVGNPPIERWVYDGFTVYFENEYVVHSVKHHQN